jgi:hypothetical protein
LSENKPSGREFEDVWVDVSHDEGRPPSFGRADAPFGGGRGRMRRSRAPPHLAAAAPLGRLLFFCWIFIFAILSKFLTHDGGHSASVARGGRRLKRHLLHARPRAHLQLGPQNTLQISINECDLYLAILLKFKKKIFCIRKFTLFNFIFCHEFSDFSNFFCILKRLANLKDYICFKKNVHEKRN